MIKQKSQIKNNISHRKKDWFFKGAPFFLEYDFLAFFSTHNTNVEHLFVLGKDYRLYAQVFVLKLFKTLNYSYSFIAYFFSFLKINVLYLGNCYMTNIPFFIANKKIDINCLLSSIKNKWSVLIIPDFIMNNLANRKKYKFFKIEVEEDMILDLDHCGDNLEGYLGQLKSKYRNKINLIFDSSEDLRIKMLSNDDLVNCYSDLHYLFNSVVVDSKFNGPDFNLQTLISLVEKKYAKVYGYFLQDRLVAFSSEMYDSENMIAYYIGYEPELNKKHSIYGRILIETIRNAITLKSKKIIFGRSASEFKSNFGAYPVKSHIFIGFKNSFLFYFFKPFLKQLYIDPWVQRKPFKV